MRIGLVAPPWVAVPPAGYGGTEQVLDGLARGLLDAGHDVLLCTTGDSTCPVPRWSSFPQAQTERMGQVEVETRHVVGAYAAAAGCDVIHDHTALGPLYAHALGSPTPVVTTNHWTFDPDTRARLRVTADRVPVIAISAAQAATAGDVPVLRVIRHGVHPQEFPVGDGGGGYALFLARMHPSKGPVAAIRAAREAGVPLRLACRIGAAEERAYFESQVRPLLTEDVELVGEVAGSAKLELLAGATCLLNPVGWPEPFGMVSIEALACGTPVLAFPAGALPEIVDHGTTGFLCADEVEMARRLGDVAALDRSACRHAVETRFSAARMAAEHAEVYAALSGGAAGAPG